MNLRKICRKHVEYFVDEQNKTVTAVCHDARAIIREIAGDLESIMYLSMSNFPTNRGKVWETARCDVRDEWNEETGKKIAFEKLYRRELKPEIFDFLYLVDRKLNSIQTVVSDVIRKNRKYNRVGTATVDEFRVVSVTFDEFLESIKEDYGA